MRKKSIYSAFKLDLDLSLRKQASKHLVLHSQCCLAVTAAAASAIVVVDGMKSRLFVDSSFLFAFAWLIRGLAASSMPTHAMQAGKRDISLPVQSAQSAQHALIRRHDLKATVS